MLLRRIVLERYGCFGTAEFEFRRGLNLILGGNDTGKTLLLSALPAAVCGVEQGSRLRSWGDLLSCRVSLLFEGAEQGVRLTRDLESNLVRLEERGADNAWRECFIAIVPPAGGSVERTRYFNHLARLFGGVGEPLLRAVLDASHPEAVFAADGRPVDRLWGSEAGDAAVAPLAAEADAEARRQEIASLEAALAVDRSEYQKGRDYLAWVRKRWQLDSSKPGASKRSREIRPAHGKAAASEQTELEHRRDLLLAELRQQGLPERLPAELPAMFATAEGLRQELANLQLELTPLQRRKQAVAAPGLAWPLAATLVGIAASASAYWLAATWMRPVAAGSAALLLLVWAWYLLKLTQTRSVLAGLDQELQAVESKRADALARQHELAEQFEACGLPSAPVEMVKLQQLCRRNEELLNRYRELCTEFNAAGGTLPGADRHADDPHLRPEDLPEAEARLAALAASLQQREDRLQALREGRPSVVPAAPPLLPPAASEVQILKAIGQHLEKLSGGRYPEVRLEEGRLRLAVASGRWAAPAACSRSTLACLTLAARMALCQSAACRLPLPVDDLPQQLDQKRRQAALRALERFSPDCQVLLACGDEELAKRAGRERWHVIDLDQPSSKPTPTTEENADAGQLHLL